MGSLTGYLVLAPGTPQALDLSPYINATEGSGLDPAAPEFSNRVFSHSLLKEGGTLALENLQLREMVFPLRLNANSRDALDALIIQINNALSTPGQTVLFQDVGSSTPTYFDLASGQWDTHYSFFKARQVWMEGNLRLFAQPLGRTATMRLVASAAGTGPLLTMSIPSPILGDAGALIQAQVNNGVASQASAAYQVAVSVLPQHYIAEFPAASLTSVALVGGSGAVASQFSRRTFPPNSTNGAVLGDTPFIANATPYIGINRVLAVARNNSGGTAILQAGLYNGFNGFIPGPTAYLAGTTGWQLLDLGTFTIPSSLPYPTQPQIRISGQIASQPATTTLDLTDVIVLPDSQTVFVNVVPSSFYPQPVASDTFVFDAIANESFITDRFGAFQGRTTPVQRGTIPRLPPAQQASAQLAVLLLGSTPVGSPGLPANDLISASITVRERFRFAQ